jgi:hypothetical protein
VSGLVVRQLLEQSQELGVGTGGDVAVPEPGRGLGGTFAEPAHEDRGRLVGERVDARVVDLVVPTAGRDEVALPQLPHQGDRLFEHFHPDLVRRPTGADGVLVERLTGADAEREAPVQHHR